MPILFPATPTSGQTYSYAGSDWIWSGFAWKSNFDNTSGTSGSSGTSSTGGGTGGVGSSGTSGSSGSSGTSGSSGSSGATGPTGPAGPNGVSTGGAVGTGAARAIALYPTSGTAVDDTFTQSGGFTSTILLGTSALTSNKTLTIPVTDANADFVMTQGTSTIVGAKTFQANITVGGGSYNSTLIDLTGTSSNRILFSTSGATAPATNINPSAGTRIVIANTNNASGSANSIGFNTGEMWLNSDISGAISFYNNTTRVARFTSNYLELLSTVGQIKMEGTNSNVISFNSNGSAAPGYVSSGESAGTKIIFFSNLGTNSNSYAIGRNGTQLWTAGATSYTWYGNTNAIWATIDGNGISTTNLGTFNLINTNAVVVNFAGAATTLTIGATTGTTTIRNSATFSSSATFNLSAATGTALTINAAAGSVTNPVLSVGAASTAAFMSFPNSTFNGIPTVTTRSVGTKIILSPSLGTGYSDTGFGVAQTAGGTNFNYIWHSAPQGHYFYSGSSTSFKPYVFIGTGLFLPPTFSAAVPAMSTAFAGGTGLTGGGWINLNRTAAPSISGRSAGTGIVFGEGNNSTIYDSAIGNVQEASGASFNTLWLSAPNKIRFYVGASINALIIDSSGLTLVGTLVGAASQDVFNTVSTTVNAFGASTTLTIGSTTGTMTLRNPNIVGTQATQNLFHTSASTTVSLATASTTINIGDCLVNSATAPISQTVNIANPTSFSVITSNITRNINIGNGPITSASGFTTTQNINIGFHGTISSSSGQMTTVITLGGNTRISHPVGGTGSQVTQLCFFGGAGGTGGPVVRQSCATSSLAELYIALRAYGLIT